MVLAEVSIAAERYRPRAGRLARPESSAATLRTKLRLLLYRVKEMRRLLKPTGSVYLHCDSTASHYLKMMMDTVFGPASYRNEIVWKRTSSHNRAKRWGPVHDTLLYYGEKPTWNRTLQPLDPETAPRERHLRRDPSSD